MSEFFYQTDQDRHDRVFGEHRQCADCPASGPIQTITIKDERDRWVEVCFPCFEARRRKASAA